MTFPFRSFVIIFKMYDVLIIGVGPAGLTASIYASRYKLNNLLLGKTLGGTIALAHKVENYPGFESIPGLEWSVKTMEQVKKLGAEVVMKGAGRVEKTETGFKVTTETGEVFEGKTLIFAAGSERRKLNIPGENTYLGKGVSYCTTCDAPFFREKTVALIGGSDAAVSGSVHTAEFAKKVYIIYRKDKLRAEPIWIEQARQNPKIEAIYNTNITEVLGDGNRVTSVKLDVPYNGSDSLVLDGVFIEIGSVPGSALAASMGVELLDTGHVKVNEVMETNIKGVFASGDLTDRSMALPQMITACAQGAQAAASAYKFLKGQQAPRILGT